MIILGITFALFLFLALSCRHCVPIGTTGVYNHTHKISRLSAPMSHFV